MDAKWARGASTRMVSVVSQFAGCYRERAPDAALREHVRCVWVNDLTRAQNEWIRVVPDGCVDIVWTGTSLLVAGPDTRSILDRLPRGAVVVGLRFHPGAALSWFGVPLSEIVNSRVPLAEFWQDDAERLFDKVMTTQNLQPARGCSRSFPSTHRKNTFPARLKRQRIGASFWNSESQMWMPNTDDCKLW
jgi:hypothetical protein